VGLWSGRQAVTFVTASIKDWYVEHYASYYPAIRTWAATPGQDAISATSLAEAAGLVYKIADPHRELADASSATDGSGSFTLEGELSSPNKAYIVRRATACIR